MGSVELRSDLPQMIAGLRQVAAGRVLVGPMAEPGSALMGMATAHEYGATIRPKSGTYLAIPLKPEAKGRSPREFSDLHFIPPRRGGGNPVLARQTADGKVEALFVLMREVVIPERAFLRRTADSSEARAKASSALSGALHQFLAGAVPATSLLDAVGLSMAASVRSTIAGGLSPENSELTLSLKRGSTPLVDTGRLLQSISYELEVS